MIFPIGGASRIPQRVTHRDAAPAKAELYRRYCAEHGLAPTALAR
jgi:hypothetical protein